MSASKTFEERAEAVRAAIDIAEKVTRDVHPPGTYATFRDVLTNAPAKMRNLKSLAYLEVALMTEFNEGSGDYVEEFWRQIADAGLPFSRRDLVADAVARGRIASSHEYEAVSDRIVVLEGEMRVDRQLGSSPDPDRQTLLGLIQRWETEQSD